jgi:hypothetical protein
MQPKPENERRRKMRFVAGSALSLTSLLVASIALADDLVFIEQTGKGVFEILDRDESGGKSMGDVELWSAPASDSADRAVGSSSGHCTFVSETHKHCTWSLQTDSGSLVFIGYVDDTKPERRYTIVGGDGRYAGASGAMKAVDKYEDRGIYEIHVQLAGERAADHEARVGGLPQGDSPPNEELLGDKQPEESGAGH